MDARALIDRLTEREKQALRCWLEHKTAKEIALDLGISHHAVEKRLKMARTKLGVATSLEAARMLAEDERYQPTVAHSPDLAEFAEEPHNQLSKPLILGATVMIFLTTATAIVLSQASSIEVRQAYEAIENGATRYVGDFQYVPASEERVRAYVRQMFDVRDKDGSGFIEEEEAFIVLISTRSGAEPSATDPDDIVEELSGEEAQAQYIANVDKDGDGKVSPEEFAAPVLPQFLERGIPLIPADWSTPY